MRAEQEIQLLERGPFPGRMDLWAEHEHFFHGLHEQFIGVLMVTLRRPLLERGYVIGRETSLQIAEGRIPDLFVQQKTPTFTPRHTSYDLAALESLAEPGILLDDLPKMTAVVIREAQSHQLVTVIEMISPSNKAHDYYIKSYIERREEIFLKRGINVIEIDLTRSYKRLIDHPVTTTSPYHVAIFIPGHGLRVVPMTLQEPFKRIAMPLREEIIPIDLHKLYEQSYREMGLAALIEEEDRYKDEYLPYPSLLTDEAHDEALKAVRAWHDELDRVRQS
jgi:hypothetical protein